MRSSKHYSQSQCAPGGGCPSYLALDVLLLILVVVILHAHLQPLDVLLLGILACSEQKSYTLNQLAGMMVNERRIQVQDCLDNGGREKQRHNK